MTTTGSSTLATATYVAEQLANTPTIEQGGEVRYKVWQGSTGSLDLTGVGHAFMIGGGGTIPQKLVAVSFVHDSGADIAADATNHYNVIVQRMRAKTGAAIASRATTTGNAWPYRTDWNFSVATFDPTNQLFAVGDILEVIISTSGTPAVTLVDVGMTFRFEPQ